MAYYGRTPDEDTVDKMRTTHRQKGEKSNNTSGYKGVFKSKSGKWEAKIYVFNEQRYLGAYDTPEEAAKIYDANAARYFGITAFLNFPNSPKGTSSK